MTQDMITDHSFPLLDTSHLTFIVGTGRCGSTMLSNLLRKHPAVLSLSEFFIVLQDAKFQEGSVDASQFWALLSVPNPAITALLRHGITFPEFLYPISPTSRYNAQTGIPSILLTSLPHLTDEYETLYDEMQQVVSQFPTDRIERHYARLFAWLQQRFGRSVCVERSGFSLPFISSLSRLFPDARFVHIVRDGRECAMSMSRHLGFRLAASRVLQRGVEHPGAAARSEGNAISDQNARRPEEEAFDPALLQQEMPIEVFGQLWAQTIREGLVHLSKLPPGRVLTLSYEELTAHPQLHLRRLLTFIDPSTADETWIRSTSALVWQKPPTWKDLPVPEREALEAACQPGFAALSTMTQDELHGT